MKVENTVFLSYRRTNVYNALAIYQNLTANGFDVFFDYETIKSGSFEQIILNQIAARAHFLVLLTPTALKRCTEPNDWLRREIEQAIDTKRNIIPLVFEGFTFKKADKYLTNKLSMLSNYNGLSVPIAYFGAAMKNLRDNYLSVSLDVVLHPTPIADQVTVHEIQAAADKQPTATDNQMTAEEWLESGTTLNDNSELELKCYSHAIRLNPHYKTAYNNRGVVRCVLGDIDGAISDLNEAIHIDSAYTEAYNNRGLVWYNSNNLQKALTDFNKTIDLDPQYADAYYNRANVYNDLGDLDKVISDFNDAIRLNPQRADAYHDRGVAHENNGDFARANQDYQMYIELGGKEESKVLAWIKNNEEKLVQQEENISEPENLTRLFYDRNSDTLYLSMSVLRPSLSEQLENGISVNVDLETGEIVSLTILNLLSRFASTHEPESLPIGINLQRLKEFS